MFQIVCRVWGIRVRLRLPEWYTIQKGGGSFIVIGYAIVAEGRRPRALRGAHAGGRGRRRGGGQAHRAAYIWGSAEAGGNHKMKLGELICVGSQ